MHDQTVLTKNVLKLMLALEHLRTRGTGVPGLGLIYGRTGTGKTTALAHLVAHSKGIHVRAYSAITLSSLLEDLCVEVGVEVNSRRNADKYRQVRDALKETPMAVFIDEGDYLLHDSRMLDGLRDLHDEAGVPVMLVGMEGIDRKLARNPQFARRITQRILFESCDLEDAKLVTDARCDVAIAPDLLALMHRKTQGGIGNMINALAAFEAFAKGNRMARLDLAAWGDRSMFLGSERIA